MMVRVPISQKANEVGFQFLTRFVCKMVVDNALIPEFFGKFCLPFLQICRKRCKLRCVIYIWPPDGKYDAGFRQLPRRTLPLYLHIRTLENEQWCPSLLSRGTLSNTLGGRPRHISFRLHLPTHPATYPLSLWCYDDPILVICARWDRLVASSAYKICMLKGRQPWRVSYSSRPRA